MVVAIGETCVILTRNVDLSVGSVVGLSAYVSANLFQTHHGIAIPIVFLAGAGVGLVCGCVTGLITALARVPSLVVTLAMLYIVRGVDTIIAGSNQVVAQSLPNSFVNIFNDTASGDPRPCPGGAFSSPSPPTTCATSARGGICTRLARTRSRRTGRHPYRRRLLTAFVLSGTIAGLGGVIWATQYNTIDSTAATGLELQIVASVVVGGVAIFGGSGSVVGAALGALLLQTISSALNVLGVPSLWTEAIAGLLLIVAITLDRGIQLRLPPRCRNERCASVPEQTRTDRPRSINVRERLSGLLRWESALLVGLIAVVHLRQRAQLGVLQQLQHLHPVHEHR